MAGNPEKAKKYLALLDEARCNDRWSEVPELARKVGKHAPLRQCLVATARAEGEQATRNPSRPLTGPLTESSIATLRSAIEVETSNGEDVYQARTCLALGLYETKNKDEALNLLDHDIPSPTADGPSERRKLQGWTYVAAIQAAFLKEMCLNLPDETGIRHEALFLTLENAPTNVQKSDEYCGWIERFLMRVCVKRPKRQLWNGKNEDRKTTERLLAPFRAWLRHWNIAQERKTRPTTVPGETRFEIWSAYYQALSELLRCGYIYTASSRVILNDVLGKKHGTSRAAQYSEIRRVEGVYENYLLNQASFPEASKVNKQVEDFTDQVMENWSIMCGSTWQEDDLGRGGRESASRQVADILYRAATRTFHSCSILRHLFTIHASLGEFHLAIKAFDSYLGIVLKGKSRVEKSGEDEPTLDSDEAVVQTIVHAVEIQCSYGKVEQAERAEQLCNILQDWLERHKSAELRLATNSKDSKTYSNSLRPTTVSLIYRAIGISKANRARHVLDASERALLQTEAVHSLRQGLLGASGIYEDPQSLYVLALVLAETRDIETAIATAKHALSAHSQFASEGISVENDYRQQDRKLTKMGVVRCWHLLALLLSARQDYEKAEAACDAALGSFEDDEHMTREALLKQLNFFEKQQVIEIKLTQAKIQEVNSSSEQAINAASESLRLYAFLFNVPAKNDGTQDSTKPPQQLRHRGSLFHRRKHGEESGPPSTGPGSVYSNRISEDTSRPPTVNANTDGNSLAPPGSHLGHVPSHKLQKRPSKRSIHKERQDASSLPLPPTASAQTNGVTIVPSDVNDRATTAAPPQNFPSALASQLDGIKVSGLPSLTLDDGEYAEYLMPRLSMRLPYSPLPPRFSPEIEEQYALGLLSFIWVFVSGMYRRAGLYDDSQGAIEEALKLARRSETSAAAINSSAQQFEEGGWGGAFSPDQVWANAHAESARLHLAQQNKQEAIAKFEMSLSFYPDHPEATVGLSNLLLDIYNQGTTRAPGPADKEKSEANRNVDSSQPVLSAINALQHGSTHRRTASSTEAFPSLSPFDPGIAIASVGDSETQPKSSQSQSKAKEPDQLAARDRAFGLLSSLTKIGSSWDDSEAWFALARAYEESGQPDKARDVLWWVVELEEKKPVRDWACLGQGYTC